MMKDHRNPNKPIGGIRNDGELFSHKDSLYDVTALVRDLNNGALLKVYDILPTEDVIGLCRLETEFDWEKIESEDASFTPTIVCQFPGGDRGVVWGFDLPLWSRRVSNGLTPVLMVDEISMKRYQLPAAAITPDWLFSDSAKISSLPVAFELIENDFKNSGYSQQTEKLDKAFAAAFLNLLCYYEADGFSPNEAWEAVNKLPIPRNYLKPTKRSPDGPRGFTRDAMETKFKRVLAPSTTLKALGQLKSFIRRRVPNRTSERATWLRERDRLVKTLCVLGGALKQAHDMAAAKDFVGARVRPTRQHRDPVSFLTSIAAKKPETDRRTLDDRDLVLIAVWSHVNPVELWPTQNRLRAVCDFAVFVGQVSAGIVAELTPVIANQFVIFRKHWQCENADHDSIATLLMEILDKAQDLDAIENFSQEVLFTRKPRAIRGDPVNPPE